MGPNYWDQPDAKSNLRFNNNNFTAMTNNVAAGYVVTGLTFGSSATSGRAIGGNAIAMEDNGGNDPFVVNDSAATHTINLAYTTDANDALAISLNSSGGMIFGGLITNNYIISLGGSTGTANNTIRFNDVVSGAGGMYVNNANLIALMDAAHTQTGQLTINAGTVRLNGVGDTFGGASQAIRIGTGATLDLNNVSTTVGSIGEENSGDGGSVSLGSGTLTVGGDAYEAYQNSISGAGALTKSGTGTLALYGTQSYTGKTSVSGGVLKTQPDIVSVASTNIEVTGGTFQTQSANILSDSAAVVVSGGTFSAGGNDTVGSFEITSGELAGSSKVTAGTYALKGGTVTANLGAGAATASSGTTALNGTLDGSLTVSGGTVNLGSSDRIANASAVAISSGVLGLGANNDTVASLALTGGSLTGSGTLTASTYSVSSGTIDANLGAGALTKSGAGTVTISTGKTAGVTSSSVEAGKLAVNGTLSGTTTVATAGTISGSGSVGALTIASGGTLAPGNSPGTLTATSATWSNGGRYDWEILSLSDDPGTSWDLLSVTPGTLDLTSLTAGGYTINLITLSDSTTQGNLAGFNSAANYSNWLIAKAPDIIGFEAGDFTLNTTGFANPHTGSFAITTGAYGLGDGLFLTYTGGSQPVPEPGTWAAAALLAGCAALLRRRRRKA